MDIQQAIPEINTTMDAAKRKRWIVYCFIGLFVLAGICAAWNWYQRRDTGPISHEPVVADEAPKASKVPKHSMPGPKQMEVYDRQDLLKKVPVPAAVADNPQNQFTATANIPPMPYGGTAVAFTNFSSSKSGITLQPKQRPLFELGGATGGGLLGGISTRGNVAIGYVSQGVARVSSTKLGVAGGGGVLGDGWIAGALVHVHW